MCHRASGAFPAAEGVRFQYCGAAESLSLLLFDDPGTDEVSAEIELDSATHRFGGLWMIELRDARVGQGFAWRVNGARRWIVDPCALEIRGRRRWGIDDGVRDKGVVVEAGAFDWAGDRAPAVPLEDSVVYEAHLRGFTARTGGGGALDFAQRIPHLVELGVTAVEFLPLHHFDEIEYRAGDARFGLRNYWGYSTLSFYAPMARYGRPEDFKRLVRELHRAGIEVWLDVVYNHTGESDHWPFSFCGMERENWYLLDGRDGHTNHTGCGNTVAANAPLPLQHIIGSLRHWVCEYHIDGFRFDLASILCRSPHGGRLLAHPPLIEAMEADPVLRGVKLIAEAWDPAGAYQVGHFPGRTFAEWNGKYRDDIRTFWLSGDRGMLSVLATRLAGSDDLYGSRPHGPATSVNFVTCHDGFTMRDLVSYNEKHNEANREGNRDGENHNRSRNFGAEGGTSDPAIMAARRKMHRNLLATLLLSRGVPMLTAGDEFGRTQQGSNNAYCQDNGISWIDWSLVARERDLLEFTKTLIALRAGCPALRRRSYEDEVRWHGPEGKEPDWASGRALAMEIGTEDEPRLFFALNAEERERRFVPPGEGWTLRLASGGISPEGVLGPESVAVWESSHHAPRDVGTHQPEATGSE